MPAHPYIGLHGCVQTSTMQRHEYLTETPGTVSAVGPGVPNGRGEVTTCVFLLLDTPYRGEATIAVPFERFIPDDVAHARWVLGSCGSSKVGRTLRYAPRAGDVLLGPQGSVTLRACAPDACGFLADIHVDGLIYTEPVSVAVAAMMAAIATHVERKE